MNDPEDDYQLDKKIRIKFEGMPYWIMPRYYHHYVENDYERFSIRLLCNLLDKDSTLLDIGAHYGAYSLVAAKLCGSKVIALEPVDENFDLLTSNISVNKLNKNISAYKIAASDKEGMSEFNIPWASDSAGFYKHPLAETIKKQKVTMSRVDKIVGNIKIDLIKIDTEGHELHVLNGLKETLKRNPKIILLIEANPACLKNAGSTVKDLLNMLVKDFDKEVYVVNEDRFMFFRLTDNISDWHEYIDENSYANILCVPRDEHRFALFVSHSAEIAGAELAMVEHITTQRANNIFSHVVLPTHGDIEHLLVEKGISYNILPFNFWAHPVNYQSSKLQQASINKVNMEAATKICILAKELHVQLIANNTIVCPWGLPAAKALKLPLIWFIHEFGDLDHHLSFPNNIDDVRKFIVNESDLVICCSDAVRSVYEHIAPNEHSYTFYSMLDVENIIQRAKANATNIFSRTANVKLCIVGHVQPSKGQDIAIKSVAELKKRGAKAELVIVGAIEPDYYKYIKKLITSLNVRKNIRLIGKQNNPYPFIRQADIALSCSNNEAFGRNTAEAMIIGCPVIGTSSGGTLELVKDNVTGLLFTPGNAIELANAIDKLSNNKLASQLAKNAQQHIINLLDPSQSTHKLNNLIKQLKYNQSHSYASIFSTEWICAVNKEIEEKQELNIQQEDLFAKSKALEQDMAELQSNINKILEEQKSIISSTSWRLTSPLRRGKSLALRAKRRVLKYKE